MKNDLKPHNLETLQRVVIERIERDHITPRARFFYIMRNVSFWFLWFVTVLVGSVAVSILIFTELNVGWEVFEMTHETPVTFFIESMPYIWFLLLVLMSLLGMFNMRYTKHGYRHSLTGIISWGLVASLMGGIILHEYRIDGFIDRAAFGFMPFHTSVNHLRDQMWSRSDLGLYSGTIDVVDVQNGILTLRVADGSMIPFSLGSLPDEVRSMLAEHSSVRIIATTTNASGGLVVCHVFPWSQHDAESINELQQRKQSFLSGLESHIERTVGISGDQSTDPCLSILRERRAPFVGVLPPRQ